MYFIIPASATRPSLLDKNKDEDYHLKWARFAVGQCNNNVQNDYLKKIWLNRRFFAGHQWLLDEDLEAFFKDDTNQDRNRIKMVYNIIKPMVLQYRGNAIRMQINFRAKSISPQVNTRRENSLSRMIWRTRLANQPGNPFGDEMKKKFAIGDNEGETEQIHDNLYKDKNVKAINSLLTYVSHRNHFNDFKDSLATNLATSGLVVIKSFEYAGHQDFVPVESDRFFFDRTARKLDLTDSEFMGEVDFPAPTEIYESTPKLTLKQKEAIDNWARTYRQTGNPINGTENQAMVYNSGKVPVFTVYWKDGEEYEYGYVMDESGFPYFTRINYVYDGDTEPKYTDKDLIEVKTAKAKKLLNGQKKTKLWVDVLRMCRFIPGEILGSAGNGEADSTPGIVLDWGIAPYQETENIEYNSVKFPYKAYCWAYADGEVCTPIDDVINPQRMMNRIASVVENEFNNSGGSNVFIDKSMVDASGGESDIVRKMNQSQPVMLNGKGRGMQNAVMAYDRNVKAGTVNLFGVIESIRGIAKNISGTNEAMMGESIGADQAVGVTESLIQQGSLIQEPFYNALVNVYKQCYQAIATVGKRIYCDSDRNLNLAVGEDGMECIKVTRDMVLEDFRVDVERDNSEPMLIAAGNATLDKLLQFQMIDREQYAQLYGRSSNDDIAAALREKAKTDKEVARMTQKKEQVDAQQLQGQMQMQQEQQKQQQDEAVARQDITDLHAKKQEMDKEYVKGLAKIAPVNPAAQQQILQGAKQAQRTVL